MNQLRPRFVSKMKKEPDRVGPLNTTCMLISNPHQGLRIVMCVWELRTCSFSPYLSQYGIFDLEGSVLKGRYCNVPLHLDRSRTLPHPSDVSRRLPTPSDCYIPLPASLSSFACPPDHSRSLPLPFALYPLLFIVSIVYHCPLCLSLSHCSYLSLFVHCYI